MRVGFMSPFAIDDPLSWSGVVSPMFDALAAQVDVVHLEVPDRSHHAVDRALARGLRRVYLPGIGLATSHSLGPDVARRVNESGVDGLLAVAASTAVAYAPITAPIVEVSDATFRLLTGYYPMFADLHPLARWQGEALVRRSATHSARFLLASDWAALSLVHDYGVAPGRVRVAPFGPSVISPEPPPGPRPGQDLRLLFVGSDWVRKGGSLAVEIAEALTDAGTPCQLTVVGDAPDLPRHVRRLGRVPRQEMATL